MRSHMGGLFMALVGALIGFILRACFAIGFVLFLLPTVGLSTLLTMIENKTGIISPQTVSRIVLIFTKVSWWLAISACPWIRLRSAEDLPRQFQTLQAGLDDAQPTFMLGNHTSFFDTILTLAVVPITLVWRCRTYCTSKLLTMPLVGPLVKAHQHFIVPFKSKTDGDFSIDRKLMDEVNMQVEEFITAGGLLCFFPEGQLNSTPKKLMAFRFGGMKTALKHDAKLWAFVTRGCEVTWPKTAMLGGFPSDGGYSLRPLAPKGCVAKVLELKEKQPQKWEGKEDFEILGLWAQGMMQRQYDQLGDLGMFFDDDIDDKID